MKLLQIASEANIGSIGKIAEAIGEQIIANGGKSYIAYGRSFRPSKSKLIRIGTNKDVILHGIITRLFDRHGLGSIKATKKLIDSIEIIKPDIIHLHHLHGYFINIRILFSYLPRLDIPIVWTFHDCWAFTGHCCYFERIGCDRWLDGCFKCPQKNSYPASYFFDRSKENYLLKKTLFTSIKKMTIITVSSWLGNLTKRSFFANYPIYTIHNGVGINEFQPKSKAEIEKIKIKYGVENKFIILGVASPFNERKGFSDYLRLSNRLREDETIILVGLNKSQKRKLPKNIVGINRIENKGELAALYSAADVFVNATYEDSFPTTNIEALACGTPVITYDSGGSPEAVSPETGFVINKGAVDDILKAIIELKRIGKANYIVACRKRAEDHFDKDQQFKKYINIYEKLLDRR